MTDSTLTATYDDIKRAVARHLSFGRSDDAWSACANEDLEEIIKRGVRQFYMPPPLEGESGSHDWSFLQVSDTIVVWSDIAVGTATVTGGVYDSANDETPLTASTASFFASMVGKSIIITGDATRTINSYTSTTVANVSGDASAVSAATFSIAANGDYALPDDFGGIEGDLTFETTTVYPPVVVVDEMQVRQRRMDSWNLAKFRPSIAAYRPRTSAGLLGQRFELMLWSEPDTNYTLRYSKILLPDTINSTNKYPLGGMFHSETIMLSCLAVAEEFLTPREHQHRDRFTRRLAASVMFDRRSMAPDNLGYNGDASTMRGRRSSQDLSAVTLYGVLY